ncbi:MAG: response regulator transcription factor [Phycisphaeraceae bacterium]|nr:response regulator transcription factor [Phycisphaeraceae bacterium]
MAAAPIKVLCVEDNALVGEVLARKLDGNPDFVWLGWVSSSEELFKKVAEVAPDVVCMDLSMPGEDAFAMIEELRTRAPNSRVMILSGHSSQQLVEQAIDAGAWGFLSKAEDSRMIIQSLKSVAAGKPVFGGWIIDFKNNVPPPSGQRPLGGAPAAKTSSKKARSTGGLLSVFRVFRKAGS